MKAATSKAQTIFVKKSMEIKDCATNDWSVEFEFIQRDGQRGRAFVAAEDAESVATLRRKLTQKGARLPRNKQVRTALLQSVIESKPSKIVHKLANSGWQLKKGRVPWMSVGAELIGAPMGAIEFAPPAFINDTRAKRFGKSGTLSEWQERVASKANLSTSLTIGIAAAFAAPLVRVARLQNFAIYLFGPSRAGKTTTLLGCTSVYAYGEERQLPNWNSTGLRNLESACAFGDVVFPLNEVGAKQGRRRQAYEGIRDLYAQYAEGADKERLSSWNGSNGPARRFHGICFSTAEHSVSEYAALAGETRDNGELFRAIDVKAVRNEQKDVLDLAPENFDRGACLTELRDALKVCYGTAFAPYIEFLQGISKRNLAKQVKALIASFEAKMSGTKADGVVRQIAIDFGLIYAGGVLAISAKILPWTTEHLGKALKRGFADAIEASKVIDPLEFGQECLKVKLGQLVRRNPDDTFGKSDHDGYWTKTGGKKVFTVHARQFNGWFSSPGSRNAVLEWLIGLGLLSQAKTASSRTLSSEDLKGVLRRWPDGTLVRSFEFSDPFANDLPSLRPTAARKGKRSRPFVGSGGRSDSASRSFSPSVRKREQDDVPLRNHEMLGVSRGSFPLGRR